MKLKSLAILAAVVALSGCTLPYTPSSNTNPVATGITGNWELTATVTTDTTGGVGLGATAPIGIYFTQSGDTGDTIDTVTGKAVVQMAFPLDCVANIPCQFPFGAINPNLTGTIDADGNIVLNSARSGPSPVTFTINANTTNNTTLSGTYSITSTSPTEPASDSGTITGTMYAPLNGTYAGTVVSGETGQSMGVTTTLNQNVASAPQAVTASATTFTGSPCFTSAVMAGPAASNSSFLGNSLTVDLVSATNSSIYVYEFGIVSPDEKTIQFSYGISHLSNPPSCNDYGSGTLTLQ